MQVVSNDVDAARRGNAHRGRCGDRVCFTLHELRGLQQQSDAFAGSAPPTSGRSTIRPPWPPGVHRRLGLSSTACSRRRSWRRSWWPAASRSTVPISARHLLTGRSTKGSKPMALGYTTPLCLLAFHHRGAQ